MAKQDVLDAINATIVENGQKGITAQSLNNILTMMTENVGEGGSGDGALRIIVPEIMFFGHMMVDVGEFTPTSWAALKLELEGQGYDVSEYETVVNASFIHNASVAKQLLEKAREGQGVSVILDQTPFSSAIFSLIKQNNPEDTMVYDEIVISGTQPAASFTVYQKVTPEGTPVLDSKEEVFECVLIPLNGIGEYEVPLYPSIPIALDINGNLFFEPIIEEQPSNGVVTFYFPQDTSSPTSEETENNKAAYASFMSAKEKSIVKIYSKTEELGSVPFMIEVEEDDGEMVIILTVVKEENGTLVPLKFVAASDGYFNHL